MTPAFSGELMLLGWKESSTQGRTVTFLLNEDDEVHPFKDFSTKSGKRAGHRFMAVLVPIGDDEKPEQTESLVKEAAVFCRDQDFWAWANTQGFYSVASEEDAKQFLYEQLSIQSRRALATDQRAMSQFRLMAAQYRESRSVF